MNILLVDDEAGFLSAMQQVLESGGHTVVLADNGKTAREALDSERIDLVISDVLMPTLDGARFHSYVREFTAKCDIPFIFISGAGDLADSLITDPARDFFVSKTAPIDTILGLLQTLSGQGAPHPL